MDWIQIAVVGLVILLVLVCINFFFANGKQKKKQQQKERDESSYRRALAEARAAERQERVYKAQTGHISTQLFLAKEAEMNNFEEALHWYEMAAKLDNNIAMRSVIRLCDGRRDNVELREKSEFWAKVVAAQEGGAEEKLALGIAYLQGNGVEADIEKGISYITEAAELDHIPAQLFIADWYVAESNPQPNAKFAAEWNLRAAMLDNIEAQIRIGKQYAEGRGVEVDPKKATYWLEVAAEAGDAKAQYFAGEMGADTNEKGNSIAYIWLWLAAKNGIEAAATRRDHVGHLVGVDAVIGLQSMAKPLFEKMAKGKVKKHVIIKSLDKLYQRESYFPDGNEFVVGGSTSEKGSQESDVKKTESQSEEMTQSTEREDDKKESINFSQTKMDSNMKF
ncbi:sel1 repeat family protein [Aliivibrio finisterrensis]|uniref:Sel1 repeat family protein n=1 Tax=Aliivibrio finisterrensis TaxID=511998 RepID=A0A4Q5KRC9_9GAMM|nr:MULTISPECIES: tetratricopeptide repeat protein [Aliivibrio]MDD9175307.1 tetratricopeptide repeat protein [Aliivibrio sp. S3TY1]MDD9192386.1 tetratricopeptide repeat protein [Aliivibrio sp. S2TY2]RYU47602.1 sel1 repeat family protein [Aliivibrio finisterrensis]